MTKNATNMKKGGIMCSHVSKFLRTGNEGVIPSFFIFSAVIGYDVTPLHLFASLVTSTMV